jgi:hypothetical protein
VCVYIYIYIYIALNDSKDSILKLTPRIPGKFNTVPRTGTRLKKLIAAGKKPLKENMSLYHLNYIVLDLKLSHHLNGMMEAHSL